MIRHRDRKKRSWRSHLHAFGAINTGLFLIDILTGSGLWFYYPLIGWGMGFGLHSLEYFSWTRENRLRIDQAEKELRLLDDVAMPPAMEYTASSQTGREDARPRELPAPQTPDPGWQDLMQRCDTAVERAESAVDQMSAADSAEVSSSLQAGQADVRSLSDGASRIRSVLDEIAPGGVKSLVQKIRELERKTSQAGDERLAQVYGTNLQLLRAREQKVLQLQNDLQRMLASAEGFVLAAENLRLDAARLDAGRLPSLAAGLDDPLERLSEEVDILREVEIELQSL